LQLLHQRCWLLVAGCCSVAAVAAAAAVAGCWQSFVFKQGKYRNLVQTTRLPIVSLLMFYCCTSCEQAGRLADSRQQGDGHSRMNCSGPQQKKCWAVLVVQKASAASASFYAAAVLVKRLFFAECTIQVTHTAV